MIDRGVSLFVLQDSTVKFVERAAIQRSDWKKMVLCHVVFRNTPDFGKHRKDFQLLLAERESKKEKSTFDPCSHSTVARVHD